MAGIKRNVNSVLKSLLVFSITTILLTVLFQQNLFPNASCDEDKHGVVDQHRAIHQVEIYFKGFDLLKPFWDKGGYVEVVITTIIKQKTHPETHVETIFPSKKNPVTYYYVDEPQYRYTTSSEISVIEEGGNEKYAKIRMDKPILIYKHCQCHGVDSSTPFQIMFHFLDKDGPSPTIKKILEVLGDIAGEVAKEKFPGADIIIDIIIGLITGDESETIDYYYNDNFLPPRLDPGKGQDAEEEFEVEGQEGNIKAYFTIKVTTTNLECKKKLDPLEDNSAETGYGNNFSDIESVLLYQNGYFLEALIDVNGVINPPDDVGPDYQLIYGLEIDSDGNLYTGPEYFAEVEYNVTHEETYVGGLWKNVGGWYEQIAPINFEIGEDTLHLGINLMDIDELKENINNPLAIRFYSYELNGSLTAVDRCPDLAYGPISFSGNVPFDWSLFDFPEPFVSEPLYGYCSCGFDVDRINSGIIIGDSYPHGPCAGALTIDLVGACLVSEDLGYYVDYETPLSYLDSDIATYCPETGEIFLSEETPCRNYLVFGGPAVNLLFRKYNSVLPVRFSSQPEWHVEVVGTGRTYWKQTNEEGEIVEDYGIIVYYHDKNIYRHLLFVGGITGLGTLAASKALADDLIHKSNVSLGGLQPSQIQGMIVRVYDGDGDGQVTSRAISEGKENIEVVEFVSTSPIG